MDRREEREIPELHPITLAGGALPRTSQYQLQISTRG